MITSHALYQLSYASSRCYELFLIAFRDEFKVRLHYIYTLFSLIFFFFFFGMDSAFKVQLGSKKYASSLMAYIKQI